MTNEIEPKKSLFTTDNKTSAALKMLNTKKKVEEQKQEKTVSVIEKEEKKLHVNGIPTDIKQETKQKKKTNRGRKRKYEEGEMIKLTLLVDKYLSTTLKELAKSKGASVQDIMTPYFEDWVKNGQELKKIEHIPDGKKYTGFLVKTEFQALFSDACSERKITQSFVAECLYGKAILDLREGK